VVTTRKLPRLCSWFAVTTISHVLHRFVLLVCFYSNYYLFAVFYSLTTQISIIYLNIKKFISEHENICLQFCLPTSYGVVSMLSNKPRLGSVCVCMCVCVCVCVCTCMCICVRRCYNRVCQISEWVFMSKKCYINNYIFMSTLMFQDTVWYCMVSFLMNYLHTYSHFWQTLLPCTLYWFWSIGLVCLVTRSHIPWKLLVEAN